MQAKKMQRSKTERHFSEPCIRWLRRFTVFLFAVVNLILTSVPCRSQSSQENRPFADQVKAAFLCKFALFIEWSPAAFADSDSTFIIGIVGRDPFKEFLDRIAANTMIKDRKILIKRFKRYQKLEYCHILFISDSEEHLLKPILKNLRGQPTLTVGDMKHFIDDGGMINFLMKNDRIRFEINLDAAQNAGLTVSSKLSRLAERCIYTRRR